MEQLLQFESGAGTVLVEVADDEPGIERAARVDELVVKARESLEAAMDQIRVVANATLGKLQDLAQAPVLPAVWREHVGVVAGGHVGDVRSPAGRRPAGLGGQVVGVVLTRS